jgi:hypothetical protein
MCHLFPLKPSQSENVSIQICQRGHQVERFVATGRQRLQATAKLSETSQVKKNSIEELNSEVNTLNKQTGFTKIAERC